MANRTTSISRITWVAVAVATVMGCWEWIHAQDTPPTPPPPPPPRHGSEMNDDAATTRPSAEHAHAAGPTTRPLPSLKAGEKRLPVTFEGGHETDPRDHGRPVTLIAAAMPVPADVFRETFSHVHPAGPGSGGPTDAEARQNKQALLKGLSPYGITDARINAVSNYYRYMKRNHDDLWKHREAIAFAVVKNNQVVRFDIADPGAGYTTPPEVTIETLPDVTITTKLEFGTDFATNGAIKSLVVSKATTKPTD